MKPPLKRLYTLWRRHYAHRFPYAEVQPGDYGLYIVAAHLRLDFAEVGRTHLQLVEAVFHEAAHAIIHSVAYGVPWTEVTPGGIRDDLLGEQATQWVVYRAFRLAKVRPPQGDANYDNAGGVRVKDLVECPRPTDDFDSNHPLIQDFHAAMMAVLLKYRKVQGYKTPIAGTIPKAAT